MRDFGLQPAAIDIDQAGLARLLPSREDWPYDRLDGPPMRPEGRGDPAAAFDSCARLFRGYPLAVSPHGPGGRSRSMVLVQRAAGPAVYHALSQGPGNVFTIRPLSDPDGATREIHLGGQLPDDVHALLSCGVPVPRCGALLGWVVNRQVTALLAVRAGRGRPQGIPELRVMPLSGTAGLDWPPVATGLLHDARLWDYLELGQLVDVGPLLSRQAGGAFWVPSPNARNMAYIVVAGNLPTDEYWLPAGVYVDHWWLREGIPSPSLGELRALPGAVDLAGEAWLAALNTAVNLHITFARAPSRMERAVQTPINEKAGNRCRSSPGKRPAGRRVP